MRGLPSTLPILFVCEISFLLGHGLIMTLLGVRMSLEGFPSQMAGLLMSSFSLGFVLGSYFLEKRIRSVGHIRVFAACAAMLAVTAMLHGIWINPWAWLVWRVAGGAATAGLLMVMESWVSGESNNENRGKVLGWYLVISTLSLAGGAVDAQHRRPGFLRAVLGGRHAVRAVAGAVVDPSYPRAFAVEP
ncbi:MFS transporter [Halomonas sp. IOP_31]|uniref:MFS transporter n=1 Tax=Halomonas sp. IOP_31 TaxID=2876584 RepID=UPI001E425573|nr:MFS transporter [Halomonas sp. IOP_31]MCD6007058.1 MFS transporter [Halomonas sp. IOP_31]